MSLSIFLPTRQGSQRIKNKNTRKFSNFEGGLLENKLLQLVRVDVDEIILSSNDPVSLRIAESISCDFPILKIDFRPDHLASNETNLQDLISYVPSICSSEHILWTHVTSPMVSHQRYSESIACYKQSLKRGFDSLMSVNLFKNFLWDKEKKDIINTKGIERWPHTQDLQLLFEINSAIFIASKDIYIKSNDRIGNNPFLFELSSTEGLDVDWEEDFTIAEAVYEKVFK